MRGTEILTALLTKVAKSSNASLGLTTSGTA
jgi:hypothetical protein